MDCEGSHVQTRRAPLPADGRRRSCRGDRGADRRSFFPAETAADCVRFLSAAFAAGLRSGGPGPRRRHRRGIAEPYRTMAVAANGPGRSAYPTGRPRCGNRRLRYPVLRARPDIAGTDRQTACPRAGRIDRAGDLTLRHPRRRLCKNRRSNPRGARHDAVAEYRRFLSGQSRLRFRRRRSGPVRA